MITVQSLIDAIRSRGLDAAVDSDYYNDTEDIIPAINGAVRWLVSLIDSTRHLDKRVDEIIKSLAKCRIYQLSNRSRFAFEDKVWTIDAIMPLPATATIPGSTPVVQTNVYLSVERTDLQHLYSNYECKRLTIEEWALNRQNPFEYGYAYNKNATKLQNGSDGCARFAYLAPYDYMESYYGYQVEIEIRPFIPLKLATVFYLVRPTDVTSGTDLIQFSDNTFELLYEKALQFISYNQADGTNVWGVTEQDIQKLLNSVR